MKLFILIQTLGSGGAARATVNLANHWAEMGWEITILTLCARNQDFYRVHPGVRRIALDLSVESKSLISAVVHNSQRVLAVRRALSELKPDVAVAMMTSANVILAIAARGLEVLTVGSERIHPPQSRLGLVWEVLRRYTYGHLAAVTALTEETAVWLKTHTRARCVPVIPNAVTWPLPSQEPHVGPTDMLRPARKRLLGVGRLVEQKGFDLLISAFARLAPAHPDWDLVILGEGPARSKLELLVRDRNLSGRVMLPGRAGNVSDWYAAADLYVMSSRFEGFPNTLAEALAHGLPAVSFDCDTGPRDIIRDQVDGLLVPPEDEGHLVTALGRLMGDASLRQKFASRGVEARTRFSMERIAGIWERVFGEPDL